MASVMADKVDADSSKGAQRALERSGGMDCTDEVRLRPTMKDASRCHRRTFVSRATKHLRRTPSRRDGGYVRIQTHQAPVGNLPGSLARHEAVYYALKKEGRKSLIAKYKQYKIDEAVLDRIEKEGVEKSWPLPDVANPYPKK